MFNLEIFKEKKPENRLFLKLDYDSTGDVDLQIVDGNGKLISTVLSIREGAGTMRTFNLLPEIARLAGIKRDKFGMIEQERN